MIKNEESLEYNNIHEVNNEDKDPKTGRPALINMPVFRYVVLILVGYFGLNFVFALIFQYVGLAMAGITLEEIQNINNGTLAATESYYKWAIIANFGGYFCTAIAIVCSLLKEPLIKIFPVFKKLNTYIYGLSYGALLIVVTSIVSLLINWIRGSSDVNSNESLINELTKRYGFYVAVMTVVFAPIVEELTYRLGLFGLCAKKSRILGYIVSSIVFSLLHFSFSATGADLINELWNLPVYIISGAILCYAYESTGNIGCSIVAHMTNNLIATVFSTAVITFGL